MWKIENSIVLITGANSGIGKCIALGLLKKNAHVVMLCRSKQRGEKAKKELLEEVPNSNLYLMLCDLLDFSQIRKFVKQFKLRFKRLDVLINNAGIYHRKNTRNKDGYSKMIAVNHLAPFLLTNLLLPILKKSIPARIINVNSRAHKRVKIDLKDIECIHECDETGRNGYGLSKLANLLTIYKLADKLKGTGITINAVSPGIVKTGIVGDSIGARIIWGILSPFIKSPEEGAEPIIYLASSPKVSNISGEYFSQFEMIESSPLSHEKKFQDKMWKVSKRLTGLK
ncbi:MAG: SDR family NAD(P)-dependent oxidoreductase [Candidatus Lokiarchaeota archaeon]|nr:SDR family NAD(P)-dependent oxidoreductase [Candidatus Lokiarchaeota archaeon]